MDRTTASRSTLPTQVVAAFAQACRERGDIPESGHPAFSRALFEGMRKHDFIIFPGRPALADTFRMGCMGDVSKADISDAMQAIADTLEEIGITDLGRAEATD